MEKAESAHHCTICNHIHQLLLYHLEVWPSLHYFRIPPRQTRPVHPGRSLPGCCHLVCYLWGKRRGKRRALPSLPGCYPLEFYLWEGSLSLGRAQVMPPPTCLGVQVKHEWESVRATRPFPETLAGPGSRLAIAGMSNGSQNRCCEQSCCNSHKTGRSENIPHKF